ncbi:MAG: type II secretion system F family protein, partial [Verrucomicrobiota bacterium]
MPTFAYRGIEKSGKRLSGTLEAQDRRQVIQKLRASKIQPVEIKLHNGRRGKAAPSKVEAEASLNLEQQKPASKPGLMARFRKRSQLALPFFRKLYQLHHSGMSIGDAVNLMTQRMSDPGLRDLTAAIYKDLSEGRTLATSMRSNPDVFDPMMAHLLEAGEATGNIAPILDNLISHLERNAELKRKLSSALAYPILLIIVAMGVVGIFIFFLMPRIQGMLKSLG